jgi:large subunit ribosomal protein L10
LDFVKTQPLLEIKVGLVEGQLVSPQELKGIATLPSRETMMAQVMGTIQMPASQLAGAIINPIQQLLYVFQTRRDQMAAAEGSGS